jgi:branched-chain amino acid aminotransferase
VSSFIIFNGSLLVSGSPFLTADSRGFRYGEGLFETIRVKEGHIVRFHYHYQRLFNGSQLLGFEPLTSDALSASILQLCERNGHTDSARVRLTVFRGEEKDDPAFANHIIQSWPLDLPAGPQEKGLILGVFPRGRKSSDVFSQIKSNNYLLYSLAAAHARQHGWDDSLVLNGQGRVADSSIANLFYVKREMIYTPPLSEGCVAGVMRRWLLETLPAAGFRVEERPVAPEDLIMADEVFLTNAIRGVRWVAKFAGTTFGNTIAAAVKKITDESSDQHLLVPPGSPVT